MKYESLSEAYFDFHITCLKTQIDFMMKYDIDYHQMLYLKLLFFEQFELMYKYLGFLSSTIKPKDRFAPKQVNELYDKGLIVNRWIKTKDAMPDVNAINQDVVNELCVAFGIKKEFISKQKQVLVDQNKFIDTVGEELFNVYPKKNVSGMMLVACNTFVHNGIEYNGKEDVKRLYAELIKFDWAIHKEVLNKIKSDGGDVCNVKITSFVKDKMWEYINVVRNDISL